MPDLDLSFLAGLPSPGGLFQEGKTLVTTSPETLEALAASAGFTLPALAQAVPCDVEIFRRLAHARQPMAADLGERIAAVLGVDVGSVLGVAKYTTPLRGLALWTPGPPDLTRGDTVSAVPLAHTGAPAVLPEPLAQRVGWAGGTNVGVGTTPGVVRLGRNTGKIMQRTSVTLTPSPGPLVYDSARGTIWVFGNGATAQFDTTGALRREAVDASLGQIHGAVYDPFHQRVWCTDGTQLGRLDPVTGLADLLVALTDGAHTYTSRDVTVASNGHLYATGFYLTGGSPSASGRVFEIDRNGAILRVSTGIDLQSPWGIAFDGSGLLWGTSTSSDPGGSTARVWRVPLGSLIAATETITGVPALVDPTWISRQFGDWWITDFTPEGPRLVRVSDLGIIVQTRLFASNRVLTHGGRVASVYAANADPWFVWYTDRGAGRVHVMTPDNLNGAELVIDVGGLPDGVVVPP